jgi:hypothetical protein
MEYTSSYKPTRQYIPQEVKGLKIKFLPKTVLGRCCVGSILAFFLFGFLLFLFISLGQRGGQGFFDNLVLAIPGLLAALFGIAGFIVGIASVIKKERAISVFISMAIGFLITWWVSMEILFPH